MLRFVSFLIWMLTAMSSINVSIDWEAISSQTSMLDRLDDLMQFAVDNGREDLAYTLHNVYCDIEEHFRLQRRHQIMWVAK